MNAQPFIHALTKLAYASFAFQTAAVVVVLGVAGQARRLRLFILAFIATTLVVIAISAVIPAQGVWGFLHLSLVDTPAIIPATRDLHLPVFFGLRDGSYRHLVGENAAGIITFPSLHAALALLSILALWRVPFGKWASLSLNVIMIASTPIDGGHYFSDVIAGLVVASVCWIAVERAVRFCTELHGFSSTAATVRLSATMPSSIAEIS